MSGERTTVELIEDAFAEPGPGYGARLAAIRAEAAGDGVELAVDLHGALVELRFERWALNRAPGELAGVIRRLAGEAGAEALRQGRELLGELLPDETPPGLAGPRIGVRPVEEPGFVVGPVIRPRPEPEEDFTPVTWAT
ncbi:hypothetical protein [Amycolatopsis lexingtonensis]|uniref:hypothetical protein n=1 Tax=Amycolatopsis lexingtonensis TaxID=218822 RepID=UPI003F71B7F8